VEIRTVYHGVYGVVVYDGLIYLHLVEAKDRQVLTCFGGVKPSGTNEILFLNAKIARSINHSFLIGRKMANDESIFGDLVASIYQIRIEADPDKISCLCRVDATIKIAPVAQQILSLLQIGTPSLR